MLGTARMLVGGVIMAQSSRAAKQPDPEPSEEQLKILLEHRQQLPKLLAENPNYFGNAPDLGFSPQFELIEDTLFEQLYCVGLNPELSVLEATVHIKRPTGYGGDLCSPGSTEWVRFYISYDDGATWDDVGVGSFKAHDIPDSVDCAKQSTKPLVYTVAFPLNDAKRQRCFSPALPLVRAILSWQVQPPAGAPNWPPTWGNHLDRHVQLEPLPLIFKDLLDLLKVEKDLPGYFQAALQSPVPKPDPAPFSLAEAVKTVGKVEVPPHRFAAPLLANALQPQGISATETVANLESFKELDIDLAATLGSFLENDGDTTYEQLDCLGLDYNRDQLVATFTVKLPNGYSGPLCGPGSVEYVSFWIDYENTCQWSYAGTAKVAVHDIAKIPKDGLHYWVSVPAHIVEHARSCADPKIGKIRAVLSWATPPSTTNPYAMPRWGNAIETHIEVKPGRRISDAPNIDVLGGIPIGEIDTFGNGMTKPFATFSEWGSPADPWVASRQCPFGGGVTANAVVPALFAAQGRQYRLMWRPAGTSGTGTPITDPFVTSNNTVTVTRHPNPVTGLTPYLDPSLNVHNVLGTWQTRGVVVDGLYELRLEMTDGGGTLLGATVWYSLLIDNTAPHADITLTGGQPCNKATPGDTVSGTFVATDAHFGAYSLDTLPASLNPPAPTHVPASTTSPVPAGTWQLVTDGTWAQCGYVVQLWVYDRSIVDSVPWGRNTGYDDVGFCLGL
jgi:hypothetical protein